MTKEQAAALKADAESAMGQLQEQLGRPCKLIGHAAVETGENNERAMLLVYRPEPLPLDRLKTQGLRQHTTRWAIVVRGVRQAHGERVEYEAITASGIVSVVNEQADGEVEIVPAGEELMTSTAGSGTEGGEGISADNPPNPEEVDGGSE
jgi:hypothetical protein